MWGMIAQAIDSTIGSALSLYGAHEQRKWQERMAGSAHQRAVADLRAAGLNPILAAAKPAATPPGSQIDPGKSWGKPVTAFMQWKVARDVANAQISKLGADERLSNANALLKEIDAKGKAGAKAELYGSVLDVMKHVRTPGWSTRLLDRHGGATAQDLRRLSRNVGEMVSRPIQKLSSLSLPKKRLYAPNEHLPSGFEYVEEVIDGIHYLRLIGPYKPGKYKIKRTKK